MSEDIVSRGDIAGDCDGPGVVVCDQGIGCPIARDGGIVVETLSVDLEPFEGGFVDC